MRTFITASNYNSEIGEWEEFYLIDGKSVDINEYYEEQDEEVEIEDAEEEDEDDDSFKEEERLITECLDVVFGDACIDCSISKIIDLAYTFMAIGRQDAIDEMKDFVNFIEE